MPKFPTVSTGGELLNFLGGDLRLLADADHSMYGDGDLKDGKHGIGDDQDMEDIISNLSRKESRIPVPVRRGRNRPGDRPTNLMMGDIPPESRMLSTSREAGKLIEEWSATGGWGSALADKEAELKKLAKIQRRKSAPMSLQHAKKEPLPPTPTRHSDVTCPECKRSLARVTRDGVFMTFSIGFIPLLMIIGVILALFAMPSMTNVMRRFTPHQNETTRPPKSIFGPSLTRQITKR